MIRNVIFYLLMININLTQDTVSTDPTLTAPPVKPGEQV